VIFPLVKQKTALKDKKLRKKYMENLIILVVLLKIKISSARS
jgi:hypothetical protein